MPSLLKFVDGFYSDPDAVREVALRSAYATVKDSYGFRSRRGFLGPETVARICSAFGFEEITLQPVSTGTTRFYHSFGRGPRREHFYAHVDEWWNPRRVLYSMVVYLVPGAPRDAGTAVCRHRGTGLWHDPTPDDAKRLGLSRQEIRTRIKAEGKVRARWEVLDRAENVYNRAVLFPAHWYHSGMKYFGSRLESGRLYQAFWFRGRPEVFAAGEAGGPGSSRA